MAENQSANSIDDLGGHGRLGYMDDHRRTDQPVTDDWLAAVADELERRKMSQQQLAQEVGASPSTVSRLLKGEIPQSRFVSPISHVLGMAKSTTRELDLIEERYRDGQADPMHALVDELRVLDPAFARALEAKLRSYIAMRRFVGDDN